MSSRTKILEYLDAFSSAKPQAVVTKLSRGSRLVKNLTQQYEIDNVNLDEDLGKFPVGAIPYGPIYRSLRSDDTQLRNLLGESSVIPFSRVVRAGFGKCLEKSILVQLAAQKAGGSYLVSGALELDNESGADFHAFNLVAREKTVYLVDVENPFSKDKDGNVLRPYVVQVKDISPNGTIIVDESSRAGRTYCLD